MGENFRLVVMELHDRSVVCKDQDMSKLREAWLLDSGFLSQVEDDYLSGQEDSRAPFRATAYVELTNKELILVKRLVEAKATCGGRLCSCGTTAIC